MQRLLIVYNPNSSQYVHVQKEVLLPIGKMKGVLIGKFAIKKLPFDKNVERLIEVLRDGDMVIAAGGDATAAVTANAILLSRVNATFVALPYGNFNDLARTLNMGRALPPLASSKIEKLYPLDIVVDGEHWRYATCYVTIGMTAEAVELFDDPKVREKMQKGRRSSWRSYLQLAKWYFRNRKKKVFLPDFRLNGGEVVSGSSDYCALSGRSMCRVMKGGDDYLKPKVFRSENCQLTSFWRLTKLMMISILKRTPGSETKGDVLEFIKPATVEIQAEGEYKVFKNARRIEVRKAGNFIKVLHG